MAGNQWRETIIGLLAAALLALASVAFSGERDSCSSVGTGPGIEQVATSSEWPSAWQPENKPYQSEHGRFQGYKTGEVFAAEIRTYEDGTGVFYLDGRPVMIVLDPEPCGRAYIDYGAYDPTADRATLKPRAKWGKPDWQPYVSVQCPGRPKPA